MSIRKCLLGIIGVFALVVGILVFAAGEGYSSNWVRWFIGPLLWFVGGALVIGWVAGVLCRKHIEPYTGVERRRSASAANKAG